MSCGNCKCDCSCTPKKGDQGLPGSQGDPGIQGTQGIQGPNGADGADGNDGATGSQGPQGPAGGGALAFGTRTSNVNATGVWVLLVTPAQLAIMVPGKTIADWVAGRFLIMVGQAQNIAPPDVEYEDAIANGLCSGLRYNNITGNIEGIFSITGSYRITVA